MQIFVSTTSLGVGRTDLGEILPSLSGLGLDGIELGSTHSWRADLATVIRECGPLRLLTHNYFPPARQNLVLNIASTEPDVRQASLAHARACIDFSAEIRAELYTLHPGFMNTTAVAATERAVGTAFDFSFGGDKIPYEAAYRLMRDGLADLLQHAQGAGVRLAIETEGSITKPGVLLMERPEEYRQLRSDLGNDLLLNFNLAHSSLAAKLHGFDLVDFIGEFGASFAAVEISHNDGHHDAHQPLEPNSPALQWLPLLPDVPLILEYRQSSVEDVRRGAGLIREAMAASHST